MKPKEVQVSEAIATPAFHARVVVTAESNPARDVLSAAQRAAIRVEAERLLRERNNARFRALREREESESDQSSSRLYRREALNLD
ncbi:MAG: hypothetical protein IPK87_11880 [Planctomycetes bacterium]|nr:hypothetical protein [Planctomycetota bacterium]